MAAMEAQNSLVGETKTSARGPQKGIRTRSHGVDFFRVKPTAWEIK